MVPEEWWDEGIKHVRGDSATNDAAGTYRNMGMYSTFR